jgi:hypothetical protein
MAEMTTGTTVYKLYAAGVYEGTIRFTESAIMHAKVDPRRRTQMQENVLAESAGYILPLHKISVNQSHYAGAEWQGDSVTLGNAELYQKHIQYKGEVAGREVVGQVWALRKDTALDIVTVDGCVVAFVAPNRYGMEVLVVEGYEAVTPLVEYADPLLSKLEFGVDDLGTDLVPMRDGVRLATDVYLPEGVAPGTKLPTILIRTCYDRNLRKTFFTRWANKGYAVVNQDVRGRADSEGELVPFFYERDDSADTIDWIVAQDWSDGNVGMWGASYLGNSRCD